IGEIQAYRSTRRSCASIVCPWPALVDAERRVSSVATLTVCWGIDVPALLQRLANFRLRELFLLREIFTRIAWLTVLHYNLHRLHIVRFPIEIENLVFRSQKFFRIPVAFQAPRHAVWLGQIHRRHAINWAVAAETTDAPVHMRGMIVIDVIDRAIDPHPLD